MKILAMESSGASLSVALSENSNIVAEYFYNAGKIHSDMLVPLIEKILHSVNWTVKDIDKFAVSCGPGSFTGIRVAVATAKTLAQTLNKPLVCVDSVSILEAQIKIKNLKIVGAIDALRDEVYVKNGKQVVILPINDFVKKYAKYKNKILVVGNAACIYKKNISKNLGKISVSLARNLHFPKASVLALIAENIKGTSFDKAEPLYVRKSWAEENKKH